LRSNAPGILEQLAQNAALGSEESLTSLQNLKRDLPKEFLRATTLGVFEDDQNNAME
jgi:hypothetical protein